KAPFPALLLGESGTGKGLVARLLHDLSEHASAPYVDLNCAGLSHELLESELFGHERGAFTGAHAAKQGLLEVAGGGTLFLDEVGELTPSIQARLLKVLEEKTFRRVGGLRDLSVRVRLVAATNRDLRAEVEAGRFRRDLYFRLNVIAIEMPPLRERVQDIPLLARRILDGLAHDLGRGELRVSHRALRRLESYSWPGNVRELRNVLERAALLSAGDEIESSDLALSGPGTAVRSAQERGLGSFRSLESVVNEHVAQAVAATGGNLREAARRLEISPSTLYSRLRRIEKRK
ncbi:MAG TPA: sigma-54 dependent transcriptional regulator, partial [Thermoanaerobaculia bacterium]|nr:sigma-54 dependent transcriptional regulator [Thermoanaerobaculia bacterium]